MQQECNLCSAAVTRVGGVSIVVVAGVIDSLLQKTRWIMSLAFVETLSLLP